MGGARLGCLTECGENRGNQTRPLGGWHVRWRACVLASAGTRSRPQYAAPRGERAWTRARQARPAAIIHSVEVASFLSKEQPLRGRRSFSRGRTDLRDSWCPRRSGVAGSGRTE